MATVIYEDLDRVYICGDCGVIQDVEQDYGKDEERYLRVCWKCAAIFTEVRDYIGYKLSDIDKG